MKPELEELERELEGHLEEWMRENLQEHIEAFIQTHLSGLSGAISDWDRRQSRRFWTMCALMAFAVITNIALIITILIAVK